jgi:hypothetical protein
MVNNYLTKNSEDVSMANKLYTVTNTIDIEKGGDDKEEILNHIKVR